MAALYRAKTRFWTCILAASLLLASGASRSEAAGRVVVWCDDWSTSESFWDPSAQAFTVNTFAWLTPGGGKKVVVDAAFNTYLDYSSMMGALTSAGYVVTFSPTSNWTSLYLSNFDAALVEIGPIDVATMKGFVGCGGGLLVIGGNGGTDVTYNPFLAVVGLSLTPPEQISASVSAFVPHPITAGVTALHMEDPTPVHALFGSPAMLCNELGFDWLAAVQTQLECQPTPTQRSTWGSVKARYR